MAGFSQIAGVICVFVVGCSAVFDKVSLQNNAYNGILVAINPDVPEDPTIIEAIKVMITNASSVLFTATHKRAYFGDVTILVPKTWNGSYGAAFGQNYDLADVIVADANPVYGDSPYTLQYGQCGEPGSYIHVTPDYLRDDSFITDFGPRGKVFVHEWAHLRWGVFDETPTDEYGAFYYDGKQHIQPTRCPLGLQGGNLYFLANDPLNPRNCQNDPSTGLPEMGCVFVPYSQQNVNTSLMSYQFVDQIVEFCDDQPISNQGNENWHNPDAPNDQNRLCELRSVWSVIRSSVDFNNTNHANESINDVTPTFHVVQAKSFEKFVLVLDVSGSMSGSKIDQMKTAASLFINQFLPNGTKVGIVEFQSYSTILSNLVLVDDNKGYLVATIYNLYANGGTGIGSGIQDGIRVLESDGTPAAGGHLLVLTDGEENVYPYVRDVRNDVLQKEVIVDTIFFGVTYANQDLQDLSEDTQGVWFFNDDMDSGALLESFKELADVQDGDVYNDVFQVYGQTITMGSHDEQNGTVVIDSTIGNQTVFTFSYSASSNPIIVFVFSPDGSRYCSNNYGSCAGLADVDSTLKTIMFTIPGTAMVGSWVYQIITEYPDSIDIIVTSMAANRDVEPMVVESGMSDIDPTNQQPIVVYATVAIGYSPVLGATVVATITSPSGSVSNLTLLDSGSAPDIRKFDGVYSRYFTQFIEQGRYSVQVQVTGLGNQTSTYGSSSSSRASYNPGSIQSDGTVVLNPNGPTYNTGSTSADNGVSTSQLDPFTRVVSPGGFSYSGVVVDPAVDTLPPSKVIDLQAQQVDVTDLSRGARLTFSAPGSDYDSGEASRYDIRYSYNGTNELVNNFNSSIAVEQNMVLEGNISSPKVAGSPETIVAQLIGFPQDRDAVSVWFGMRAYDEAGNESPTSNIGMMNVFIAPYVVPTDSPTTADSTTQTVDVTTSPYTTTTTTTTEEVVTSTTTTTTVSTSTGKSDTQKKLETFQLVTIILAAVCIVLICSIVAIFVTNCLLSKQRKKYNVLLARCMGSHNNNNNNNNNNRYVRSENNTQSLPEVVTSGYTNHGCEV